VLVISSFLGSCQDADAEGESPLAHLIHEQVCRIADVLLRALGRLDRPSPLNLLLGTDALRSGAFSRSGNVTGTTTAQGFFDGPS